MVEKYPECACIKCQELCLNPGFFSPEEAKIAIEEGLSYKLMLDYYIVDSDNVYILCPASEGCECNRAKNTDELFHFSFNPIMSFNTKKGRCVFQKEGLCSIHDTNLKPIQCRSAMGCKEGFGLDGEQMKEMWDNQDSQDLVKRWMNIVGLDETVLEECF